MKICVVSMIGCKYKCEISEEILDTTEDIKTMIEEHLKGVRAFTENSKAVQVIRGEEERNGLSEYWIDAEYDENGNERVKYLYFADKYENYTKEKKYYFNTVDLE